MERTTVTSVWSPAQGTSLWVAAWLYGRCSYDLLLDALVELGGPHFAVLPDGAAVDGAQLLRLLRRRARVPLAGAEPIVRLVMSGPGDVPTLPAGSSAAVAATEVGAALVFSDAADSDLFHVLVPYNADRSTMWHWHEVTGPLPALPHLSPGEADLALSETVRAAAKLVSERNLGSLDGVKSPRLTVGLLSDVLATAGLPAEVPLRAQRLFARADQVDAILDVVRSAGAHAHALDPELLPLKRVIRAARVAGVDYTQREWLRSS